MGAAMNSAQAAPGSGFIGDEAPVAQRVSPSGGRWGRAAMASLFVVGAAVSVAIHEDAWSRIASSNASPLDWLYAITAGSGVVTGLLFSFGRATVGIASAWICYCLIEAVGAYPFWAVPPGVVAENATGFFSHLAVAASLMLYISVAERRE
jgi:hypothetical protein